MMGFADSELDQLRDDGFGAASQPPRGANRALAASHLLLDAPGRCGAALLSAMALVVTLAVLSSAPATQPAAAALAPLPLATLAASASSTKWRGVSLGGWLVMEINPSVKGPNATLDSRPKWMFDQFEAASELDFVSELRGAHGDDYAIATMRNHWSGYITERMLDDAQALGVDTVRIPVGYWIVDSPDGGRSPLEYGISPEGFITGGLNHLLAMLVALKKRKIGALIDIHSMPCNSYCVSDGLSCAAPLAFAREGDVLMAPGAGDIGKMARCRGGAYPTTRKPTQGTATWRDVGVNAVSALAEWIAALPEEAACVVAFQLANEPAIGIAGSPYLHSVNLWYERALQAAREHLPSMPLVLSWLEPSDVVTAFLKSAKRSEKDVLVADHHYYLNWLAIPQFGMPLLTWAKLHRAACAAVAEGGLEVYTRAKQPMIIGEWSLAVNLDQQHDLDQPEVRRQFAQLYREQISVFAATEEVIGHFFWTLRMGSGWDPRPDTSATLPRRFDDASGSEPSPAAAPPNGGHVQGSNGRHVQGASAWRSLGDYPYKVWSFLEMSAYGIVTPLDELYTSACPGPEVEGAASGSK